MLIPRMKKLVRGLKSTINMPKTSTLIIAEAGINHNGNLATAFQLIDAAAKAGVDVVKFQTFTASYVISSCAPKAEYQKETTGTEESQLEMAKKLELPPKAYARLAAYCKTKGVEFLSTPFDEAAIDLLNSIGMRRMKIPSGEITNLPYLRKIGALKGEIILSTGMSTLQEVEEALHILEENGTPRAHISLLHCTTEYPAPIIEVNLRAMETIRSAFPEVAGVGYSDHTQGIEVALAAVALGATIIEKHFTLDKNMQGPDHKASLDPAELKQMCRGIRHIELALGSGIKVPTASEMKNRDIARKSIVAKCPIQEGEILTSENMTTKRPGSGVSPMLWDEVIGTPAPRNMDMDELL